MTTELQRLEIINFWNLLVGQRTEPSVVELRVPKFRGDTPRPSTIGITMGGYYTDYEAFIKAALSLSGKAPGIYATINPVHPDLLGRSANRNQSLTATTSDKDILNRRVMLIDCDPVRPTGISSTDAEHDAAIKRGTALRQWLATEFGMTTALADSGNGCHLLARLDLPNDAESTALLQAVLLSLDKRFSDDVVGIDKGVFNAARISKIIGTRACKGDSLPDRPHRDSYFLEYPELIDVIGVDILTAIADMGREKPVVKPLSTHAIVRRAMPSAAPEPFDVPAFLQANGIDVHHENDRGEWHHWVLTACPFNSEHTSPDSMIAQHAGGAVTFKCLHNSCSGNDWHTIRYRYDDAYRTKEPFIPNQGRASGKTSSTRAKNAVTEETTQKTENRTETATDGQIEEIPEVETFRLTNLGNAERMVKQFGDRIRYCTAWNQWLIWDGKRWAVDITEEIARLATTTVRSIYNDAAREPNDERRVALAKWAHTSEKTQECKAMLTHARSREGVAIDAGILDSDQWLLNLRNGTIDLTTGRLGPHLQNDLITKMIDIEYDKKALYPRWIAFLEEVIPDPTVRAFIKRAVGYSLSGSTREHCFFFLYGTGRNGKSTFTDILTMLLSDFATNIRADTLMVDKHGANKGASPEMASLQGKRIATVSELSEGGRIDEALIKSITGGDPITARYLNKNPVTFFPTHKIWMFGNHYPGIRGTDEGIWSRPKPIPFTQYFDKPDRGLKDKLIAELPGILNWAIEGCLEWQDNGLQTPRAVEAALDEYREGMDILADFFAFNCVVERGAECDKTKLWETYEKWAIANGGKAFTTSHYFSQSVKKRPGVTERRTPTKRIWVGFRLKTWEEMPEENSEKEEL